VLTVFGKYHWSAIERHERLTSFCNPELALVWSTIQKFHAAGLEFKLHPRPFSKSPSELEAEFREISKIASHLCLWLESRRLNCSFASPQAYALNPVEKCAQRPEWRNYLLNLRTFGPKAALSPLALRYPRERLLNALPLLLWNGEISREPAIRAYLQKQLSH